MEFNDQDEINKNDEILTSKPSMEDDAEIKNDNYSIQQSITPSNEIKKK